MDARSKKLPREGQMSKTLNLIQKQKLTRKVKFFILKEGIMYKVGQNNRMHKCSTTLNHILF
jgi:hypothetical protein